MEELFAADIAPGEGLTGDQSDAAGSGFVVVLSRDSWIKVCHEANTELPWLAHGANLLIKGFEFLPTDIGRELRIGEAVLEIVGAQPPGPYLEQQAPALFEAMQLGWRGGVVCKIVRGGSIQTGDNIHLSD